MNSNWHNVSRREPCPICHKPDWCTVSNDGAVCVCRRVESPHPSKSGMGWIHGLRENEMWQGRPRPCVMWQGRPRPCVMWQGRPRPCVWNGTIPQSQGEGALATSHAAMATLHASFDGDEYMRDGLALSLGLDYESFEALDVRYNHAKECMSFPMRDPDGNITGLRYRHLLTGKKWSERGSHDGLFYALSANRLLRLCASAGENPPLYITEGPTDTAAALSMGLNAVGRSSCMSGTELLKEFIRKHHVKSATIVADGDKPGWDGAKRLAAALPIPTRLIMPPPGYKDLRDWYRHQPQKKRAADCSAASFDRD